MSNRGDGSLILRKGVWQHLATEADGRRRWKSTRTRSRTQAMEFGRKRMEDIRRERDGLIEPRDAAVKRASRVPLAEHATVWAKSLGGTPQHADWELGKLMRILAVGNLARPSDLRQELCLEALRVYAGTAFVMPGWKSGRRPSQTSVEYMRRRLKAFAKWMAAHDRLRTAPDLGRVKSVESANRRRPLTRDEVEKLLAVAENTGLAPVAQRTEQPTSNRRVAGSIPAGSVQGGADSQLRLTHGSSERCAGVGQPLDRFRTKGQDRRFFYEIALYTGLRLGEMRRLTPAHFHLSNDPPFVEVRVEGARAGKRKPAEQPMPRELAARLRDWLASKENNSRQPLFTHCSDSLRKMLRRDCQRAGIADWRQIGVHHLRHTFCYRMKESGVSFFKAVELMRHSDPRLTQKTYGRLALTDIAGELEKLLPQTRQESRRSYGP
jgi:integrase